MNFLGLPLGTQAPPRQTINVPVALHRFSAPLTVYPPEAANWNSVQRFANPADVALMNAATVFHEGRFPNNTAPRGVSFFVPAPNQGEGLTHRAWRFAHRILRAATNHQNPCFISHNLHLLPGTTRIYDKTITEPGTGTHAAYHILLTPSLPAGFSRAVLDQVANCQNVQISPTQEVSWFPCDFQAAADDPSDDNFPEHDDPYVEAIQYLLGRVIYQRDLPPSIKFEAAMRAYMLGWKGGELSRLDPKALVRAHDVHLTDLILLGFDGCLPWIVGISERFLLLFCRVVQLRK